ncbi:hypothetical protein ASC95_25905 [Pelomonas sp. Root1217]|uniref:rubrivinodin family lasso peptide n=1 Tax=Pelomonas sp. Root1217 TaxID=1736430 RepID=UPI000713E265|nr:rubrivinodin family lasso peptide [Pelomonas sp. Root1217]KQV46951.1 hypothetical protein ASC95_25905 [Pelomonas sp. Root1217]
MQPVEAERKTGLEQGYGWPAQAPLALAGLMHFAEGIQRQLNLKENVMNEDLQLEIVDLGDAKEETKGRIQGVEPELNEAAPYKP